MFQSAEQAFVGGNDIEFNIYQILTVTFLEDDLSRRKFLMQFLKSAMSDSLANRKEDIRAPKKTPDRPQL